ncbi:MAG TPA: DinB family protein [Roseiflexaceae bacterium]|nr:DinB family protein [Roseiflexaceae bacterium]
MLDFTPIRNKQQTMAQLVAGLAPTDLRRLTNEMIDTMQGLIAECVDADVTFEPSDPGAHDPVAATSAEVNMPWTLGHLIVHVTASAEEAAAIAAELARGVPHRGGRSRSEVPWTTVTTIEQCRQRLEESRRMQLASLGMWPDRPDLTNNYLPPREGAEPVNAVIRFVNGLRHDADHLGQIGDVVGQARAAR